MRVLHMIGSLERGGTEGQLVGFIERSGERVEHRVVLFDRVGPLARELPDPPAFIGPLRRTAGWPDPSVLLRARRQVALFEPDVVHAHLTLSELVAAAATPSGVPLVISKRGQPASGERRPWLRPAIGMSEFRASLIISNTRALLDDRRTPRRVPAVVIPNGVDLERFDVVPIPRHAPTVVMVANLREYKRHDLFLRAFACVVRQLPAARASLVGDGPERSSLEELVVSLGLQHNVTFEGALPDPRPVLARAHVVALTSAHEGLPNALLEAMAMGRPVVSTPVGGVPELVRDGVDGVLVSPDEDEIAGAVLALLPDHERVESMGRHARARATRYSWQRVVDRTVGAYGSVLRSHLARGVA